MQTSATANSTLLPLEGLRFSNSFAQLPNTFYSRVRPTPLQQPFLISFNPAAAALLDLDPQQAQRADFADIFNGAKLLPGSDPIAMLYAGHQFGHYVPQLGDGRAIILGEVNNRRGERWELQLKGAGQTPYSRDGDGRAVLRSTIREYLCSEAMHGLGIPTTRALCMIGSAEPVYRENIETGAMLLRMAPSHVRFGSFEVFYYRNQFEALRQLADYVIAVHYPQLQERKDRYLALLQTVVTRTAELIARWQLVGFAHGVMNTDNMSILGLTLDYGPFGFLDDYEPGFICNHSDPRGRYAFDQQPDVALWNLSCLAQALLPLLHEQPEAAAEQAMAQFDLYRVTFDKHYQAGLQQKLGLTESRPEDRQLAQDWLDLLANQRRDYTNSWRLLADFDSQARAKQRTLRDHFIDREAFDVWADNYASRLRAEQSNDPARRVCMQDINPKYVLRNYLAQTAIEQAQQGDYSTIERLLQVLQTPFSEQPEAAELAEPPPDWGRKLAVSCSS